MHADLASGAVWKTGNRTQETGTYVVAMLLLLLQRLGEVLDVLGHQQGLLQGSEVPPARLQCVAAQLGVLLLHPQLGAVHQLVGEAGETCGYMHRHPGEGEG